jgi:hypothetical protein
MDTLYCICTCVLFRTVSETVPSQYSSEIVDKEILRTVCSAGVYRSSDKVGTVYTVLLRVC